MSKYPNAFVFMWPPCAGKGTQSLILAETLSVVKKESWEVLDRIINWTHAPDLNEIAQKIRKKWSKVSALDKQKLAHAQIWDIAEFSRFAVLDWYARDYNQYKVLCEIFWIENITILFFNITQETMLQRAQSRYIDPKTKKSYRLSGPAEANQLWFIRRESDIPKNALRRYSWFEKRGLWIIESHRNSEWNVIDIDASKTPEEVTEQMLRKIKDIFPEILI